MKNCKCGSHQMQHSYTFTECVKRKWWNFFRHDKQMTGYGQGLEMRNPDGKYRFSGDGKQIQCLICQKVALMDTPEGDKIIDGTCHLEEKKN